MHKLLARTVTLLMALAFSQTLHAAEVGDDGLHKEAWFTITFRDIADDIAQAKAEGKRLALTFEQRGCIYCAQMHEKILSDPEVRDYIAANFMVVQYNMFGDEEVTDLDGETLTEKNRRAPVGLRIHPDHRVSSGGSTGRQDGGGSRCGHHARRLREMDLSQHVPLGEGEGLRARRALPAISCAHHKRAARRRPAWG